MTRIKINGCAISNHWLLLQNKAGQIFERVDIPPSYPSPNWYFNGGLDFDPAQSIPVFELPDGEYNINPQNGSNFSFTVQLGKVNYASDCAGFLQGAGTDTLTLKGFDVTIDARYLIGNGLTFWGVLGYGPGDSKGRGDKLVAHRICTLLPGNNYYFVVASGLYGDFYFSVDKKGKLSVEPKYAAFMEVCTGNILQIKGFPLLIDGTKNGSDPLGTFGVYNLWDTPLPDNHTPWTGTKVIMGNFVPTWESHGYFPLYTPVKGNSTVSKDGFRLSVNGTVIVSDPKLLKVDVFNGIQRITVLKPLPPAS